MDLDRELKRLEGLFFTEYFQEQRSKLKEISVYIKRYIEEHMTLRGERIPDHTLINEFEMDVRLSDFTEGERSLIFFYRGSWCPYSSIDLEYLMNHSDDIREMGYHILVISNSLPQEGSSLYERVNLPVSILSDPDNFLADALGLTYELTPEIEDIYHMAGITPETGVSSRLIYPSILLVDARRNITDVFIREDEIYLHEIQRLMGSPSV